MENTILTAEMKFTQDSVPSSLCHHSKDTALHDALCLAEFLQTAISHISEAEWNLSDYENRGMNRCFDLLTDKIKIGAGIYEFPMVGYGKFPKLCSNRKI